MTLLLWSDNQGKLEGAKPLRNLYLPLSVEEENIKGESKRGEASRVVIMGVLEGVAPRVVIMGVLEGVAL